MFRPNHLEILEKHFQEDSYPSFEKREEMARACNAATESLSEYTAVLVLLYNNLCNDILVRLVVVMVPWSLLWLCFWLIEHSLV